MPPSRYRVVERGRRLIVIDTHGGNVPVTRASRAQPGPGDGRPQRLEAPAIALGAAPRRAVSRPAGKPIETGDPRVLTTQPWFDDKAPRRLRIPEGAQGGFGAGLIAAFVGGGLLLVFAGWPVLVVLGFLLVQPRARKGFRRAVTRWLDRFEQV